MSSVLSCLEALLPLIEFLQDILLSVISKVLCAVVSWYSDLPDIKGEMPGFSSSRLNDKIYH